MARGLTAGELRKALEDVPDNTIVILGDDDEMNGVHNAWHVDKEKLTNIHVRDSMITGAKSIHGQLFYDEGYDDGLKVYLAHDNEDYNDDYVIIIT